MGHSATVERCKRFNVRLPGEVRKQLVVNSTLKRARSCVSLGRMSSGRRGYRTRSVESEWQYERLHGEEQWGLALRPMFFAISARRSSPVERSEMAPDHRVFFFFFDDERSSDHLCPGILDSQGGYG